VVSDEEKISLINRSITAMGAVMENFKLVEKLKNERGLSDEEFKLLMESDSYERICIDRMIELG